jgi:hypothetical protein
MMNYPIHLLGVPLRKINRFELTGFLGYLLKDLRVVFQSELGIIKVIEPHTRLEIEFI